MYEYMIIGLIGTMIGSLVTYLKMKRRKVSKTYQKEYNDAVTNLINLESIVDNIEVNSQFREHISGREVTVKRVFRKNIRGRGYQLVRYVDANGVVDILPIKHFLNLFYRINAGVVE